MPRSDADHSADRHDRAGKPGSSKCAVAAIVVPLVGATLSFALALPLKDGNWNVAFGMVVITGCIASALAGGVLTVVALGVSLAVCGLMGPLRSYFLAQQVWLLLPIP